MCILCVIQKWSRRVATMLPWLVLPLIGLWALSQMLPPAFRFEITSPRLACVFVLLVTLFWYEILMPKLSAWRAHRNARLRERKRNEAIELQKLRKTATRKCRNCLTPYRDQNPCGGKFMCSYCGHISKRPVLDLPVPPGISNSGIIKELVGKGGKLLNGRVWSENGWMCSQDWRDNGNWGGGTFAPKPVNWRKNGNSLFGGDEHCLAEKSYSGVVIFTCKLLTSFFLSIRWLWRKIFSGSSSSEDVSFNNEHSGILSKRGECFHESRSEKARRKAEERRQARLERELLEEEERKQREEVARLVEERRKLRDEKIEAEKDGEKVLSPTKEKDIKREAEKKRHERRRDRDKGSSKSNSDAEELEKRAGKETDRRSDNDGREIQKSAMDMMVKGQTNDIGRGPKNVTAHNVNRGSAGARYLDRMRNNIISSSKAFSGTSFFGRAANTPVAVAKESKPGTVVNHVHPSAHRREIGPPERVAGKSVLNGVPLEPQPLPAPKKSWQQLFTRSTPVHPSSTTNLISRPNNVVPNEVKSPMLPGQTLSAPFNDKQINFGLPSPFPVYTLPNAATSSSLGFTSAIDPIFPHVGGRQRDNIPEEPELFEDPCYVPDPVSLLGPVSESLDNFQLDLGSGFISEIGLEKQRASRIAGPASEISRPSPIESPMSRLRGVDDRHNNANRLPGTPKSQDKRNSQVEDGSDEKTWQLWGPSPLGQDGLGLIGGPVWHLNPDRNRSSKEELTRPSSQRTMASLFAKEDPVLTKTYSPQKDLLGGGQNGVNFSPAAVSNDKDPWVQKAFIPPLSDNEKHFAFKRQEDSTQSEVLYGSPTRTASTHPFVLSPADCWSKQEWAATESGEHSGSPSLATPHIGDAYPPQIYSHFGTLKGK